MSHAIRSPARAGSARLSYAIILGPEDCTLSTPVAKPDKEPQKKAEGARRRAAVVVSLVCVGVVAAIVAMNGDRLSVHSDVSEVPNLQSSPTSSVNTPPVIQAITAASDRIAPFDLCMVVCDAVDMDGDPLSYTWTASQGDIFGEGASIEWGAPTTEGLFTLSVTVDDGRGGTAGQSTSLRVKTNYAPAISTLSAFSDWIIPGSSTYISCAASDADGDEVAYEWTATGGEMFGQGHSIVWVAPTEPGSYWVTVFARDAYGGEARRGIPISVAPSEPPTIGKFVVKGIDSDLVRQTEDGWKIFRGNSCSIECVVTDGDGPFTFEWRADGGTLMSDGAVARWDAFNNRGTAAIVVDVIDVHGNIASGIVSMSVETCTCAFK